MTLSEQNGIGNIFAKDSMQSFAMLFSTLIPRYVSQLVTLLC